MKTSDKYAYWGAEIDVSDGHMTLLAFKQKIVSL